MTNPGASSSPPGIGFGAGEGPAAAIVVGDAKVATLAPATEPAAVRTNRRLPRTPPADEPVMRLLSLEKIIELFARSIPPRTKWVNAEARPTDIAETSVSPAHFKPHRSRTSTEYCRVLLRTSTRRPGARSSFKPGSDSGERARE